MSTTPNDGSRSDVEDTAPSKDPRQIEADIARHRQELGQTVDELTNRLDVKKQAQRKVAAAKSQADHQFQSLKARAQDTDTQEIAAKVAPALAVVALVTLLAGVVRRVRR